MFRCYAAILEQLRLDFHLVGLSAKGFYDDGTLRLFDEFVDVMDLFDGKPLYLDKLAASIKSWQPAAIYYPSIGMSDWAVQLSQLRLAPTQVMTLGHPATSMSPEVDYALVEESLIGDQLAAVSACFSEKLVKVPSVSPSFRLPPNSERIAPLEQLPEDGIIRIAIPSVAQKLSAGFIRCLQQLEATCPDRVHLVFFLGEKSLQSVASMQQIRHELKHTEFHVSLPYNDYIYEINRCQLHAGSFPFGGTNSLVDSLRQGLPIVAMEGTEPHARIDAAFIRKVGLDDSFICQTEDAFAKRLIELVEDPDELLSWKRHLLHQTDVDELLLKGEPPSAYRDVFRSLISGRAS